MRQKLIIYLLTALLSVLPGFNFLLAQDNSVVVSNKPFTESYILAEIIIQLLENETDLKIEHRIIEGGTTSILHPAIVNGEIDIYPEYTGTAWQEVLKQEEMISDPIELYYKVAEEYQQRFDLTWLPLFGFNNTFTLAVKAELAQKENLKTFSDLALVSEKYIFGAEPDFFEREDGFDNLAKTYGFNFKSVKEMAIALKYPAILSGEVDVINSFSTDGLLRRYNLVILEDDKHFFPSYYCAPVIRTEIIEAHPEIIEAFKKIEGKISDATMTELNFLVDEKRMEPKEVARQFLESIEIL
ncbi:MAG: osmoprotectant transport system substrate-binding protein opuBD [Candidatus Atribacteria bacterium]|nr:osmoprotectant transport system substrate-binding protein opuBD [Candidatus Atribacteria bacterium]